MSYASAGEISRQIHKLANICIENNHIDPNLYDVYHVKKGLREPNGKGVLTGLTEISTVNGTKEVDGKMIPIEGEVYYRGININDLVEKARFRTSMNWSTGTGFYPTPVVCPMISWRTWC